MNFVNQRFVVLILVICFGWIAGLFYSTFGQIASPSWLPIAMFNSVAAGLSLAIRSLDPPAPRKTWLLSFLPALLVVSGSAAFGLFSSAYHPAPASSREHPELIQVLGFIVWIPVIEELIFRRGVGGVMRRHLGNFWGAYVSAIFFALAHSTSGFDWPSLPWGPLLLGFACEWLYAHSNRISAAILLHAACNASALIFQWLDPRWLEWLDFLYLKA